MTLIHSTESVFQQLTHLLSSIEDKEYSLSLDILSGNSIGKHVRHIVEFYECLVSCSHNESSLDYDLRKRNLVYETNTTEVIEKLKALLGQIKVLSDSERTIELYFLPSPEENAKIRIGTTIDRELAYNLEHAIHHMAIIRIAVNFHFKEINLEKSFGIAPSTIKYINNADLVEPVNR